MKQSTNSSSTHINVESASTLNRKYVHRPASFTDYNKQEQLAAKATAAQLQAEALKRRQALAAQMNRQSLAHLRKSQPTKAQPTNTQPTKAQLAKSQPKSQPSPTRQRPSQPNPSAALLAQAAKNRATDAALQSAALQSVATSEMQQSQPQEPTKKSFFKKATKKQNRGRLILALAASAACVVALGLIVKLNMPDLSVRVAALQTGIEATYPSYIPNGFQLSGVSTGKNDSITMDFSGENGTSFKLTEEKSPWDSNALLNNYVKEAWGTDYIVVREQGITIYLSSSDATWVNGGLLYHLTSPSADTLTKKEIKNIVTSL